MKQRQGVHETDWGGGEGVVGRAEALGSALPACFGPRSSCAMEPRGMTARLCGSVGDGRVGGCLAVAIRCPDRQCVQGRSMDRLRPVSGAAGAQPGRLLSCRRRPRLTLQVTADARLTDTRRRRPARARSQEIQEHVGPQGSLPPRLVRVRLQSPYPLSRQPGSSLSASDVLVTKDLHGPPEGSHPSRSSQGRSSESRAPAHRARDGSSGAVRGKPGKRGGLSGGGGGGGGSLPMAQLAHQLCYSHGHLIILFRRTPDGEKRSWTQLRRRTPTALYSYV